MCCAVLGSASCDLDLERMIDQPRMDTYEACDPCPDGTSMLLPPPGTVARGEPIGDRRVQHGLTERGWVERIPIPVDRELLHRGRNRFEIACSPCHGRLGDGDSVVAKDMVLRPPPSLLAPPIRNYPPGRIYTVIEIGWGLMPPYSDLLDVRDRWAVIAYVQALQLRRFRLGELPPRIRERANRSLP